MGSRAVSKGESRQLEPATTCLCVLSLLPAFRAAACGMIQVDEIHKHQPMVSGHASSAGAPETGRIAQF